MPARRKYVQIENKNALVELLEEGRPIERIYLANNAFKDDKTKKIVSLARAAGIPIDKVARKSLSRRSRTSSSESIIGMMPLDNMVDIEEMLEQIYEAGKEPFILILSDIKYPQNIAAIFRTAFAAGVNGVITPVQKGNLLSDEVIRISMGTCLRIPIAEMNLHSALKRLQQDGVTINALHMDGKAIYDEVMVGPQAIILGSEDLGIAPKLLERSDRLLNIPMSPGLGSLNVGVSAALAVYEKFRQERVYSRINKK